MKKHLSVLVIIIMLFVACKSIQEDAVDTQTHPYPFNGPGITRERVVEIATKYGLQDSIAPGYVATGFKLFPEEAYPYMWETYFESFFSDWRKYLDSRKRLDSRRNALNSIHTVQQYFTYLESDPEQYKSAINFHSGEGGYAEYKKEALAGKWHIYISNPDVGTVTSVPADGYKPGTIKGRLLRNEN